MALAHSRTRPYGELLVNYLHDLACVRGWSRRFRPLVTNLYLTKRCNLRCRYCYPPGEESDSDLATAIDLLSRIRPHNPVLNLTGGEPLLYPEFRGILEAAVRRRFHPILLSTNGLLLDQFLDAIPKLHHLVVTLHATDPEVNDRLTGVPGASARILDNLRRAASQTRAAGVRLTLHGVIAPETIDHLETVVPFCREIGATLAVSPEHGRFDPNPALRENGRYRGFLDRLIHLKAAGAPIASSFAHLRAIRDFAPHRCHPHLSPRVEPDGRVYFPCQRIAARSVFLQEYPSLLALMRAEAHPGPADPACARRCFLSCYLEVDRYLQRPLSLLPELLFRDWVLGRKTAAQRSG